MSPTIIHCSTNIWVSGYWLVQVSSPIIDGFTVWIVPARMQGIKRELRKMFFFYTYWSFSVCVNMLSPSGFLSTHCSRGTMLPYTGNWARNMDSPLLYWKTGKVSILCTLSLLLTFCVKIHAVVTPLELIFIDWTSKMGNSATGEHFK